ncbi:MULTISPECIES: metal-sensing transcriptional repressor [Terrabacteria group]|uniref:metal-sensing transcriptional repressor n=1 Tax=Bacillati TaxID=1783272 RepID=UPI001C6EFE08|nr:MULTISPECIES: metal-sensing transcriptional repressor [Terrabacteria group]MBW9212954.1 metal-sensing transcriptional repressor [Trueperella sp. zg.1013]
MEYYAHEYKQRSEAEKKALFTRLHRIEGQIRGIEKMVDEDQYCPNIVMQVSAVSSALNSFSKELMASHIQTCVVEDLREGNEESIQELVKMIQKLMK